MPKSNSKNRNRINPEQAGKSVQAKLRTILKDSDRLKPCSTEHISEFGTKDGETSVVNLPFRETGVKPENLPFFVSTNDEGVLYQTSVDERPLDWDSDLAQELQEVLTREAEDLRYRCMENSEDGQRSYDQAIEWQRDNKGKKVHQPLLRYVDTLRSAKEFEQYAESLRELRESLTLYAERSIAKWEEGFNFGSDFRGDMAEVEADMLSVARYDHEVKVDKWRLQDIYIQSLLDVDEEEEQVAQGGQELEKERWEKRAEEIFESLINFNHHQESALNAQAAVNRYRADHSDDIIASPQDIFTKFTITETQQHDGPSSIKLKESEKRWRPELTFGYIPSIAQVLVPGNTGIHVYGSINGQKDEYSSELLPLVEAINVRNASSEMMWNLQASWHDRLPQGQVLSEAMVDLAMTIEQRSREAEQSLLERLQALTRVERRPLVANVDSNRDEAEVEVSEKSAEAVDVVAERESGKEIHRSGTIFAKAFESLNRETLAELQEQAREVAMWRQLECRADQAAEQCWSEVENTWSECIKKLDENVQEFVREESVGDTDKEVVSTWVGMVKRRGDPSIWRKSSLMTLRRMARSALARYGKHQENRNEGQTDEIGQGDEERYQADMAIEAADFVEKMSNRGVQTIPRTVEDLFMGLRTRRQEEQIPQDSLLMGSYEVTADVTASTTLGDPAVRKEGNDEDAKTDLQPIQHIQTDEKAEVAIRLAEQTLTNNVDLQNEGVTGKRVDSTGASDSKLNMQLQNTLASLESSSKELHTVVAQGANADSRVMMPKLPSLQPGTILPIFTIDEGGDDKNDNDTASQKREEVIGKATWDLKDDDEETVIHSPPVRHTASSGAGGHKDDSDLVQEASKASVSFGEQGQQNPNLVGRTHRNRINHTNRSSTHTNGSRMASPYKRGAPPPYNRSVDSRHPVRSTVNGPKSHSSLTALSTSVGRNGIQPRISYTTYQARPSHRETWHQSSQLRLPVEESARRHHTTSYFNLPKVIYAEPSIEEAMRLAQEQQLAAIQLHTRALNMQTQSVLAETRQHLDARQFAFKQGSLLHPQTTEDGSVPWSAPDVNASTNWWHGSYGPPHPACQQTWGGNSLLDHQYPQPYTTYSEGCSHDTPAMVANGAYSQSQGQNLVTCTPNGPASTYGDQQIPTVQIKHQTNPPYTLNQSTWSQTITESPKMINALPPGDEPSDFEASHAALKVFDSSGQQVYFPSVHEQVPHGMETPELTPSITEDALTGTNNNHEGVYAVDSPALTQGVVTPPLKLIRDHHVASLWTPPQSVDDYVQDADRYLKADADYPSQASIIESEQPTYADVWVDDLTSRIIEEGSGDFEQGEQARSWVKHRIKDVSRPSISRSDSI